MESFVQIDLMHWLYYCSLQSKKQGIGKKIHSTVILQSTPLAMEPSWGQGQGWRLKSKSRAGDLPGLIFPNQVCGASQAQGSILCIEIP